MDNDPREQFGGGGTYVLRHEAQARLAEATRDRDRLRQSLQDSFTLTQQLTELAQAQFNAGTSGKDEVLAAEKALLETRLRMNRLDRSSAGGRDGGND